MSIADSLAKVASLDATIDNLASAIRPITQEQIDDGTTLVFETIESKAVRVGLCVINYYEAVIRFHVVADSYPNVNELSEALKDALIGYRSEAPPADCIYILRDVNMSGETDIEQVLDDGNPTGQYIKTIDFDVKAKK